MGSTASGIILLALSGALDALDGTIAREFETASQLGGILDLTIDRIVEVAVLLGLVWRYPAMEFASAVVLASWYVNITVFMATGAAIGGSEKLIHYPPGLVERTEALVFFVVLAIVPAGRTYICYCYAALEIATTIQRMQYAWRYLRRENSDQSAANVSEGSGATRLR